MEIGAWVKIATGIAVAMVVVEGLRWWKQERARRRTNQLFDELYRRSRERQGK